MPSAFDEIAAGPLMRQLLVVSRVLQLASLVALLESCKEFGFDLEAHNARTYHGLTCLLQISTESKVRVKGAFDGVGPVPFHFFKLDHVLSRPVSMDEHIKIAKLMALYVVGVISGFYCGSSGRGHVGEHGVTQGSLCEPRHPEGAYFPVMLVGVALRNMTRFSSDHDSR